MYNVKLATLTVFKDTIKSHELHSQFYAILTTVDLAKFFVTRNKNSTTMKQEQVLPCRHPW